jgi:predicted aspartyl protease
MVPYRTRLQGLATKLALTASTLVLALGLGLVAVSERAGAADAMHQGTAFFKAKDYGHAAAAYKVAMGQHPNDATIAYYYAVSLHYSKQIQAAKLAYLDVLTKFPSSPSASYAQAALASLDPSILGGAAPTRLQTFSGSSAGGGNSNGDIIPSSSLVNFERENDHMMVDVAFNGRRTKAIFDTGAETILIGKNTLAQLGLPMPGPEIVGRSRGVGGKIENLQGEYMDVTVGGVTRKHILVCVQENLEHAPLLGLPFVQGMNYAIESNCIRFTPKNTAVASSHASSRSISLDSRSVPFTIQGRSIIVNAQVNGRNIPMCFDTGAGGTLFSKAQADAAGIRVPENAEIMVGSGVGGTSIGSYVPGVSIRLGSVDKRDMKVGVDPSATIPYPLLGRDFWGDLHYSFDNDNHTIRFN